MGAFRILLGTRWDGDSIKISMSVEVSSGLVDLVISIVFIIKLVESARDRESKKKTKLVIL